MSSNRRTSRSRDTFAHRACDRFSLRGTARPRGRAPRGLLDQPVDLLVGDADLEAPASCSSDRLVDQLAAGSAGAVAAGVGIALQRFSEDRVVAQDVQLGLDLGLGDLVAVHRGGGDGERRARRRRGRATRERGRSRRAHRSAGDDITRANSRFERARAAMRRGRSTSSSGNGRSSVSVASDSTARGCALRRRATCSASR